jgi:membrane-associated phospholipid phosphatase
LRFSGRLLFSLLVLLLLSRVTAADAADTLFNGTAAWKQEFSRLGGETKTMVTSPVDTYPVETAAVAGLFALGLAFDREIRNDLAANRSNTLKHTTDVGSLAGEPLIHIGVAAAIYGAGAVADAPRLLDLGSKIGEALILTDTTGFLLKVAVGRGRPETGRSNVRFQPFTFTDSYSSLPSMHTASSFALAHVLSRETDSLPAQILCYAAASFVGFSRLYRGEHWASDVILGAALGELAGAAVTRYRGGKIAVAPTVSGGAPGLALTGRF